MEPRVSRSVDPSTTSAHLACKEQVTPPPLNGRVGSEGAPFGQGSGGLLHAFEGVDRLVRVPGPLQAVNPVREGIGPMLRPGLCFLPPTDPRLW
jgi:hypothetical protein